MTTYYTTNGSVRGCCGHKHRSVYTAAECKWRDQRGCKVQGGYSDREGVRGDGEPLDEWEMEYAYSENKEV